MPFPRANKSKVEGPKVGRVPLVYILLSSKLTKAKPTNSPSGLYHVYLAPSLASLQSQRKRSQRRSHVPELFESEPQQENANGNSRGIRRNIPSSFHIFPFSLSSHSLQCCTGSFFRPPAKLESYCHPCKAAHRMSRGAHTLTSPPVRLCLGRAGVQRRALLAVEHVCLRRLPRQLCGVICGVPHELESGTVALLPSS